MKWIGMIVGFLCGYALVLVVFTMPPDSPVLLWFNDMHTFWLWMAVTLAAGLILLILSERIGK